LRNVETLGSEEGKYLGSGFSCEQRKENEQGLYSIWFYSK
jgi:hypothetical protein